MRRAAELGLGSDPSVTPRVQTGEPEVRAAQRTASGRDLGRVLEESTGTERE